MLALCCMGQASGHGLVFLNVHLTEQEKGFTSVSWQAPAGSGLSPSYLGFRLLGCQALDEPQAVWAQEGFQTTQHWHCPQSLGGKTATMAGPAAASAQIALQIRYASGWQFSALLSPVDRHFQFPLEPQGWSVWLKYTALGLYHIWSGIDHLLFITALMLLVRRPRPLLGTVSGFTAGHSLTLSLAALTEIHPPAPPTEAAIALSILYLAFELTDTEQKTLRQPWWLAAAFGLLHGFGFAGALTEMGLPYTARLQGLVAFNMGVEIGQIAFIATCMLLLYCSQRVIPAWIQNKPWLTIASFGLGTWATFWLLERSSWLWISFGR